MERSGRKGEEGRGKMMSKCLDVAAEMVARAYCYRVGKGVRKGT